MGAAGQADPLSGRERAGPPDGGGEPGAWAEGRRQAQRVPPVPPRAGTEPPELAAGPAGACYGLYVHVPFCRARCPYCDFNVALYRADRVGPLVAALRDELARHAARPWAGRVAATSLYLGGGTPALLPPEAVGALVGDARAGLGLRPDAEVTLEANPEGLDASALRDFRAAGITRLSLGVQALDDEVLARLGRGHTAGDARRAFAAARAAGFDNVSVDLIFACPDQDRGRWTRTLDEVLGWAPEHLSAYALTLEPGTRFGRSRPAGLPDEDTQVAQFETLVERATAAGLERYEVSNFARPGHRSRHNLLYWRREDYLGIGPGAHGALGPLRWSNLRSHVRYRAAVAAGASPVEQWERLTPAQVRGERLVLGLRLVEGVPRAWVEDHLAGRADRLLARYLEAGVVAAEGERIALTGRGVLLSDTLLAELV